MSLSEEDRRRIEESIAERDGIPSLREQLIIRAEALALARESLGLEGRDLERNLREERRFLDLVRRFDEGETVAFPHDVSYRAAPAASENVHVTLPAVSELFGLFAPFDKPTLIDNPIEGRFHEVIKPGALRDTIAEQGHRVPLRLSHGTHPYVGHLPVGRLTELYEDRGGGVFSAVPLKALYVRDMVLPMVHEGLAGTSFGFRPAPGGEVWTRRDGEPFRELRAIDLAEITITDRPQYSGTKVGWRSRDEVAARREHAPEPTSQFDIDRQMELIRLGIR